MVAMGEKVGGAAANDRRDGARSANRTSVRFVLSFAAIVTAILPLYMYPFPRGSTADRVVVAYLQGYARLAGAVLSILDSHVRVTGQQIDGRSSLEIVRGCDGFEVVLLFAAAVVASHIYPWKARLTGLAAGGLLITLANVCRICSLYYVGIYWPSAFDFIHLEVWPIILIATALGCFLVWTNWARGASDPAAVPGAVVDGAA